jgi:hypothetical protein
MGPAIPLDGGWRMTPSKIFGIGLSRTGTLSLHKAFLLLGLRSRHYVFDPEIARYMLALENGTAPEALRLTALDTLDCISDAPVCGLVGPLDAAYPGSRFVLTIRDEASWLDSCERHFTRGNERGGLLAVLRRSLTRIARGEKPPHPLHAEWRRLVIRTVYGVERFDRAAFAAARARHLESVRSRFRDRPGTLLVLDICAGEGWDKLCPFLGLPVPANPFPWEHRLYAGPRSELPASGPG